MQSTYEAPPADINCGAGSSYAEANEKARREHLWLASLMRELFQTERSAKEHPLVEAERLGDAPPAQVMRAVAEHAEATLDDLPRLAKKLGLPDSPGGEALGKAFSVLRDTFGDLLLSSERSYRGTILGMQHGMGLVELVRSVAQVEGSQELVEWCSTWLARRKPLVKAATRELAWFAAHPDRATEPAKTGKLATSVQALALGFEQLAERFKRPGERPS